VLRIDHVVFAVADLETAGTRLWGDHGLASVPGGRHEAWGTANRIVPLGDDYIELLGVVDPIEAGRSPFGTFMRDLTLGGDRWYTLAIRDDELDATTERLSLRLESGERVRPDGRVVRWRRGLLEDPALDPWLPFFIEWNVPPELMPGRALAQHRTPVTGISWVDLGGDEDRLAPVLAHTGLPVRLVGGDSGVRRVGLALEGGGELVLH
jgi:glyoxalase-like protein